MLAASPAPDCTVTAKPSFMSFWTTSGTVATRLSPGNVSFGIPIDCGMILPPLDQYPATFPELPTILPFSGHQCFVVLPAGPCRDGRYRSPVHRPPRKAEATTGGGSTVSGRHQVECSPSDVGNRGSISLANRCRSSRFRILPLGFFGRASTNITPLGDLKRAKRSAQCSITCDSSNCSEGLTTTTATTASIQRGCGSPMTATSLTCGIE